MITTAELLCIKGNISAKVGAEAIRYNNREKGGYDEDFSIQQLMCLDFWVLDSWEQNDDGTITGITSNYISQAEFDALIGRVRLYAACAS